MSTRQRIFAGLGGLFALAAIVYTILWFTSFRYYESTDNAYVHADISVISPKVSGYLASVDVTDNAYVHKGDVLATIEPRDFEIAKAEAEAQLETQKSAIATIAEQVEAAKADAESAKANVASADAQALRARTDYRRYEKLARQDFASRQKLDSANADMKSANAALAAAKAKLHAATTQIAVLKAQKVQQEARLKQVQADLDQVNRNLAYTVIRAPVDGVIGNRHMDVGQLVQPGNQLASLVALPHVYVDANFKETQIENMKVGQTATIVADAWPDTEIKGTVESFSPASGQVFSLLPAENATGNFTKIVQRVPVRIALPDANKLAGYLRPGLSVTVTVDTRTGDGSQAASATGNAPANANGVFGTAPEKHRALAESR
ncbi:HlyD family secretion protein [Parvibaculum sp.]|uniref:HlyD family secretion protein n=1 Tax=Parvibaculum sp. TaxID=2024848 RepID=UPI000C8A4425|nr:HlyD family secretion protein [Parvibaculum sp.]MAB13043.1 hemolysin D [Parvibaculum sp.]